MTITNSTAHVEQWGIFELTLHGSTQGNPYLDVELTAQFTYKHRMIEVDGFYDGDGVYRVRFMPDTPGTWRYRTQSNRQALSDKEGSFSCTAAASACNHGPVRVANTYHFAYADGTPYKQIGTTCYAWTHQGDWLEEQTLATLRDAPFNKLRMCVFPKSYDFNHNEPELYPFPVLARGSSESIRSWEEKPRGWSFDWSRFEPAFFRHLERRVGDLQQLGIEADIILFHPYDRWGFISMDADTDDRYLRYVVARLAAYRNVWWSMANEWDLARNKTMADWDRYFRIVQESDPYDHLRSIHQLWTMYDHSKPWVTHQSIQHSDLERVAVWREQHRKPVVVDECCYEGNIPTAGATLPAKRWCAASGKAPCRAATSATAIRSWIRRTSCGGQRAACCMARARRAWPSCGASSKRVRPRASTLCRSVRSSRTFSPAPAGSMSITWPTLVCTARCGCGWTWPRASSTTLRSSIPGT